MKFKLPTTLAFLLIILSSQCYGQDFSCRVSQNKSRRQQIAQAKLPYNMVAYIKMTRNRTVFQGSACLIAPRVLLTAGHNLRLEDWGSHVNQLEAWLGATGQGQFSGYQVFATVQNDNIFTLSSFNQEYTVNEDFAIAILPDSSLYKKVGQCFQLSVCDSAFLRQINNQPVHITGYPYDQPEFTMWDDTTPNYYLNQWNNITDDTYGVTRMSGSPVWIKQGDKYLVFAVHTQGSKNHKACSIATPISAKVYAQIVAWCKSKGVMIN
jgi:V8-like Glu-specific endopeptidase